MRSAKSIYDQRHRTRRLNSNLCARCNEPRLIGMTIGPRCRQKNHEYYLSRRQK